MSTIPTSTSRPQPAALSRPLLSSASPSHSYRSYQNDVDLSLTTPLFSHTHRDYASLHDNPAGKSVLDHDTDEKENVNIVTHHSRWVRLNDVSNHLILKIGSYLTPKEKTRFSSIAKKYVEILSPLPKYLPGLFTVSPILSSIMQREALWEQLRVHLNEADSLHKEVNHHLITQQILPGNRYETAFQNILDLISSQGFLDRFDSETYCCDCSRWYWNRLLFWGRKSDRVTTFHETVYSTLCTIFGCATAGTVISSITTCCIAGHCCACGVEMAIGTGAGVGAGCLCSGCVCYHDGVKFKRSDLEDSGNTDRRDYIEKFKQIKQVAAKHHIQPRPLIPRPVPPSLPYREPRGMGPRGPFS